MPNEAYYIPAVSSTTILKIKKSKFIALVFPVDTQQEVECHLVQTREKYPDASHHCYAWYLRQPATTRSYDDGEPPHTAGSPILNAIKAQNLSNILVIVVRYFGGTKLGAKGLIQAYKQVALEALEKAGSSEIWPSTAIEMSYAYPQSRFIDSLEHQFNPIELFAEYKEKCYKVWKVKNTILPLLLTSLKQALIHFSIKEK